MGKVIGTPRSGGAFGNVCAFCHFFGGNPGLERYKINDVQYDGDMRAQCLERRSEFKASAIACPKFQMSNDADRHCKL